MIQIDGVPAVPPEIIEPADAAARPAVAESAEFVHSGDFEFLERPSAPALEQANKGYSSTDSFPVRFEDDSDEAMYRIDGDTELLKKAGGRKRNH
jgi:hypothetical protein